MRILIVSCEAWRETNNGGNVLSNIFSSFDGDQIAQVYCSGEMPANSICRRYFQISESMLLTKTKGRELKDRDYFETAAQEADAVENRIKSRIPGVLREAALFARELLWSAANWKTRELENFVRDFAPDVIFAPCYAYYHVSMLALHVQKIAGCPMISYISDDNYSLAQLKFSPSFWINRLITRHWIRRHFAQSAFVYTMTEKQKQEYERKLKHPMKILCKAAECPECRQGIHAPVQFIYAGGLYLNRWKILSALGKELDKLNADGICAQLHIYSGTPLSKRMEKALHYEKTCILHDAIPFKELEKKYREADVAIHAESFDLKNRLITRLSFSTKIIDCLCSGCAVLAIGPETQAGIAYLKAEDGAICVNRMKDIGAVAVQIVGEASLIPEYAEKARKLVVRNHEYGQISAGIKQDFANLLKG